MFISLKALARGSWQAFERIICRLLVYEDYEDIRLVGRAGDKGADIIAHKQGKRWLFQAKHWKQKAGVEVVDQTVKAMALYKADIPVVVSLNGFQNEALSHQRLLMSRGVPLQLIDGMQLEKKAARIEKKRVTLPPAKDYQEEAISILVQRFSEKLQNKALVVMATGLGKTFTAAEALRRMRALPPLRVLVLAHTNEIVYQLEKAFWPFLSPSIKTLVWNGSEQPGEDEILEAQFLFACVNSVAAYLQAGRSVGGFDVVVVDECHHVGGSMYLSILDALCAGKPGGPFLTGLTATPWRRDDVEISSYFGEPAVCVDMVTGLRRGFLSNVDYRMYTDNINWSALSSLKGTAFSPRQINRTLFINQWDDGVVFELRNVWKEVKKPRCIVFCGTIDHAVTMRDRINALGFCRAAAIYSQSGLPGGMSAFERTRLMCAFHDGEIDVVCAVDVLNEGVDVPDVNIIVFQRVTHSRRIFIQQLGRGLRIAEGKEKVIVLDFVSDIRRFAAGISLKDGIEKDRGCKPVRISLPHKVTFRKTGGADPAVEIFLREWLHDVAAIEDAGEDAAVLRFPPEFEGRHGF